MDVESLLQRCSYHISVDFHRLLFELDTTTDPVWHCLSSQYRWIKKIMTESYDEQIALVEGEDCS